MQPEAAPTATEREAAQKALAKNLADPNFTGTAIIVRGGHIIAHLSRGYQNAARGEQNSLQTTFEIDSVQKAMTGALIMQQIQAGKLSLTTTLNQFYPQIKGSNRITIRQLLDMTSGLMLPKFKHPAYVSDAEVVNQAVRHLISNPAKWNTWQYQPVNYTLLCGILARVTGQTYAQLFNQQLVQRYRLTATHFAYQSATAQRAQGYVWDKAGKQVAFNQPQAVTTTQEHYELGTGQVFMSAPDLYKLEAKLVSGQLLGQRATNVLHWPGSRSTYGGGLYTHFGSRRAQGYGYGYETFVRITPNGQNAVIIMSNTQPSDSRFLKAADQLALAYAR